MEIFAARMFFKIMANVYYRYNGDTGVWMTIRSHA